MKCRSPTWSEDTGKHSTPSLQSEPTNNRPMYHTTVEIHKIKGEDTGIIFTPQASIRKNNEKSPSFIVPSIRVTDFSIKPKFRLPIKMCDMDLPDLNNKIPTSKPLRFLPVKTCDMDLPKLKTPNPKTQTSRPSKFHMPVKMCDMNLPEPKTSKPKTSTSKPLKFSMPVKTSDMNLPGTSNKAKLFTPKVKTSGSVSNAQDKSKLHRAVRRQLCSVKKSRNMLSITMKPEKEFTIAKSAIPKIKKNLDDIRPLLDLDKFDQNPNIFKKPITDTNKFTLETNDTTQNRSESLEDDICRKLDELEKKIDQRFNELTEKIEKLELKCNCNTIKSNNETSKPKLKNSKFEILEQKLNRGSPISEELSESDTESPIIKMDINFLINDKSDIKKSFSTSNLATNNKKVVNFSSENDIRSKYEEIRCNVNFLCTPKNTTKVKKLMTPSVNTAKKIISRTIQKQLIMLDDL